ncbi:MAG: hypothetical protein M3177_05470, partial [Pseudomonadota bacterium]|nr:hypothetical protein [Pseudomonadota bacterium]
QPPPPAGGDQRAEARGLPSLPAVIEALKSLLTALSSAKIWLALTIVGLLLLWMAATAPRLCVIGDDGGDRNGGSSQADTGRGEAEDQSGNGADAEVNVAATAPQQDRSRPPGN